LFVRSLIYLFLHYENFMAPLQVGILSYEANPNSNRLAIELIVPSSN